jgi:hypothetical protein
MGQEGGGERQILASFKPSASSARRSPLRCRPAVSKLPSTAFLRSGGSAAQQAGTDGGVEACLALPLHKRTQLAQRALGGRGHRSCTDVGDVDER